LSSPSGRCLLPSIDTKLKPVNHNREEPCPFGEKLWFMPILKVKGAFRCLIII
jgi:hypothetical protein